MPVARTAIGCLVAVGALVGLMLLVRPAIFSLAPPRDDASVVVASTLELTRGPVRREVVLTTTHGLDGERALDAGRVQVAVIASSGGLGVYSVVNGASSVASACPVEIAEDRLVDCDGRAWTLDGTPIDDGLPPLQRFTFRVRDGALVADLTRPLERP
jgi:hypothetical protein